MIAYVISSLHTTPLFILRRTSVRMSRISFYVSDLDKTIQRFREKKLQNAVVSAEKVQVTNCILVRGLAANTSKDMMELYFENHRKSGGGPVSDVQIDTEENCAVVVFEEYSSRYFK